MTKGASRKSSKSGKGGKGSKKAAAKPKATKAAAKKASAKKASAKKASAKKPVGKKAHKPAGKKPAATKAAKKPAVKTRSAVNTVPAEHGTPLAEHAGKAMIIQILGDAEAYFFDFDRLGAERRAELIEHHLAAWDQRKRAEGQPSWAESFVPVALLGESMPPAVRSQFDLSAPHSGVMLYHRSTGSLLHAASKHDAKLAVMAPDIETISPNASFLADVFDPAELSYAYAVDQSESDGFTRANIEMLMQTGGAELILV